jgi:8-oxo-dGTP pyrophosphatase MutT (NUDIX family)
VPGPSGDWRLAAVIRSLEARVPLDGREEAARAKALEALATLPHPFDRHADLTHVTGSALIVGPRGVVLHRHRRLGLWVQPGGHVDRHETPWEAARREAVEETGLAVHLVAPLHPEAGHGGESDLIHVDVHPGGRGHTHLDLRYLLEVDGDDTPRPPEGESQEVHWFGWDDAVAIADPGVVAILRALRPA